mmetsp:Transcript_31042/g.75703  ORF Transcript_31042/g.75703 Transcript_31042/m.75703 type:complete len:296 (-) Transcript_31042:1723-2610(-)
MCSLLPFLIKLRDILLGNPCSALIYAPFAIDALARLEPDILLLPLVPFVYLMLLFQGVSIVRIQFQNVVVDSRGVHASGVANAHAHGALRSNRGDEEVRIFECPFLPLLEDVDLILRRPTFTGGIHLTTASPPPPAFFWFPGLELTSLRSYSLHITLAIPTKILFLILSPQFLICAILTPSNIFFFSRLLVLIFPLIIIFPLLQTLPSGNALVLECLFSFVLFYQVFVGPSFCSHNNITFLVFVHELLEDGLLCFELPNGRQHVGPAGRTSSSSFCLENPLSSIDDIFREKPGMD